MTFSEYCLSECPFLKRPPRTSIINCFYHFFIVRRKVFNPLLRGFITFVIVRRGAFYPGLTCKRWHSVSTVFQNASLQTGSILKNSTSRMPWFSNRGHSEKQYRARLYSTQNTFRWTQAGPGRTVKLQQEQTTPNLEHRIKSTHVLPECRGFHVICLPLLLKCSNSVYVLILLAPRSWPG